MTTDELRSVLLSIANTLDQGATIFPSDLDKVLINLLSNLDDTSTKILATVLNMPVDQFKSLVPNVINLLKAAENLFETNQHAQISHFCRALASRPFVLAIIARFI